MTHKELVSAASQKLSKWGCLPICTEMVHYSITGEIPDAIGWTCRESILIECKSTRNDFLRDKNKLFRFSLPDLGMGDFRFYLTNENVIHSADELPPGWGCYEASIGGAIKWKFGVRYTNCVDIPLNGNKKEELRLMRSFIRRNLKK